MELGANVRPDGGCSFLVWAPEAGKVELKLIGHDSPGLIPMERDSDGCYSVTVPNCPSGARYLYRLNEGIEVPDPASRFQPEGVHGPSAVVDPHFDWTDPTWFGTPLRDYVIYELHVGTFSEQGTFEGVIPRLPELKALGITAIEIMPVAQFPGKRNWGYDGVGLFAVQDSYGGPLGLKRLVNAAHEAGIAVILDVVYNHLGPEGNYLNFFGHYFTDAYKTPWGNALNFDGPGSNHVRRFFIQNALYWQTEFHLDALRLDAVHAIRDVAAISFLRQLSQRTTQRAERVNRRFYLIAESDLNAPRFILPEGSGGYGLHAQWADDFHHCLHVLLTGETRGYYEDYTGGISQFAKVWREGYAFTGQYSPYRKALHGDRSDLTSLKQFVICAQNHDQIGNRMAGDRLSSLVDFESLKLAAAAVLLSPFIPMLFMGEEYGETAPFQYMVDHGDPDLLKAVQQGRREEFASFAWKGEVPDPGSEQTFNRSRLNRSLRDQGNHKLLFELHRRLLEIRRSHPCFTRAERSDMHVSSVPLRNVLQAQYLGESPLIVFLGFGKEEAEIDFPGDPARWQLLLNSAAPEWGGHSPEVTPSARLKVPPRAALVFVQSPS